MKAAKRVGKQASTPSLLHSCTACEKVFTSSTKLEQHSSIHTGERPFKCGHCDKSFSSKFKLMRHTLIHSNERKYACTYCERCFHRKDHLKNHMQVHNPNKKVHRCEHCSKEYNSRLCFRKHVAIHAAEAGDLNCKVCNKNFTTSEEILYHLKVHAGSRTVKNPNEKKFKCDFCERRFFTRKDVKRHLVVHTGRRDFLCQFCPQRFGRKDHLVRHIKKGHALLAPITRIPNKDGNCGESSKSISTSEFVPLADSQLTLQSVPCQMPFVTSSSIPSNTLTIPAHFEPGINSGVGFYQVARGLPEMEIKTEPAEDSNERPTEEGNFDFAQFLGFVTPASDVGEEVPPLPRFSQAFQ